MPVSPANWSPVASVGGDCSTGLSSGPPIAANKSRPCRKFFGLVCTKISFSTAFPTMPSPIRARLAKRNKCAGQAGFINAIIRRFLREKKTIFRDISTIQEDCPALGQSHPDWLFDNWEQRWGREKTIRLLEWNNQPRPDLRPAQPTENQRGDLGQGWDEQVEATAFDSTARKHSLSAPQPPAHRVRPELDGLFYIQDPSTLLSVDLLDPKTQPSGARPLRRTRWKDRPDRRADEQRRPTHRHRH